MIYWQLFFHGKILIKNNIKKLLFPAADIMILFKFNKNTIIFNFITRVTLYNILINLFLLGINYFTN